MNASPRNPISCQHSSTRLLINGEWWTLPSSFVFEEQLGHGAYGSVAKFFDQSRGFSVAVKRIGDVFRDPSDAKRILRELKILRHLKDRPNIVSILDILAPSSPDFDEIYIVLECLKTDLHRYMHTSACNEFLRLTIFELLRSFVVIHKAGILHRDVKPSNILIGRDSGTREPVVKLCDFGLARQSQVSSRDAESCCLEVKKFLSSAQRVSPIDPERCPTASTVASTSDSPSPCSGCLSAPLTEYVVTRWYRAPEILLNTGNYGPGIDIWGIGCVIAEMVKKQPLFTGWNNDDQLVRICRVLGKPDNVVSLYTSRCQRLSSDAQRTRQVLEALPPYPRVDLAKVLPTADEGLLNLLEKILVIDPAHRWTAEMALAHPWFQDYQPWSLKDIEAFDQMDWSFDTVPLIKRSVQTRIYEEIITYWHPEIIPRDLSKIIHFDIKIPEEFRGYRALYRDSVRRLQTKRQRETAQYGGVDACMPETLEIKRGSFLSKVARCVGQRLYSSVTSSGNSDDLERRTESEDNGGFMIPINN